MSDSGVIPTEVPRGSGLHRTVFRLEVLSDRPAAEMALADLAYEIERGDFSGFVQLLSTAEITQREMALALVTQGSDPDFLLGEDGWRYALQLGDEVAFATTSPHRIQAIEYLPGDIVRITDILGRTNEVPLGELS